MTAFEELKTADATAAGMNRGLNVEPIRWSELLALAQQQLNSFQHRSCLKEASDLYDEELATPLIAAARIVFETAIRRAMDRDDYALTSNQTIEPNDSQERHLLLVLASAAFGMYGNFPSAAAVQRMIDFRHVQTEGQWLSVTLSNPSIMGMALQSSVISEAGRAFLERLNMFLITGDELEETQLIYHFEELMRPQSRSVSDVTLLRCARLSLQHCINLSISKLRGATKNPVFNEYIKAVMLDSRPCLLPPQFNLVSEGFLDDESNSIVTIPTSTGKTLLAEMAIAARIVQAGDVSIFVAPYVALGRQVYESFRKHVPSGIDVLGYFGGFNSEMQPLGLRRPTIIVATPERADAILRTQDLYGRLRTVVFDEAHGVVNGVRGVRLECLIGRLRLQQQLGQPFRIILMSAVLSDVDELQAWLGDDARHFQDSWRPTSRRLAIWTSDGKLGWLYGNDPLRPESKQGASYLGQKTLDWPEGMRPASHYGAVKAQLPIAYQNVAFLSRHLHRSIGGPILIACYAKQTTRGVAAALANDLPEKPDSSADLDALLKQLKRYPHLSSLAQMVRKGVAYHNSSLPNDIKPLIEKALKSRGLDFVAATTTLAEGVDLPFRCTVIFDWLIGFGDHQSPMHPLLFRNIAGRCGRAGEFVEGDTIIFDNVLGSQSFVDDRFRRRAQAQIFSDPPPLKSDIANDNAPADSKEAIRAILASQLLAAIPENPNDPNVEISLSQTLLATQNGAEPSSIFKVLREELLSTDGGEPFALAASPMWLTPLGKAANRTGFGPATCRKMLSLLSGLDNSLSAPILAAIILTELGECSEQNNHVLREVASGRKSSRMFVRKSDLEMLAAGWLNGIELSQLFVNLPKAKHSKAAVTPSRWASGESANDFVAAQYDKFVELVEYAFGGFLPWVLRSLATLESVTPQPTNYAWGELARMFESGRMADPDTIDAAVASLALD